MMQSKPLLAAVIFTVGTLLGAPAALTQESVPEEVEIIGERRLYLLEEQVLEAQDAVYALYNELNDDDLYDIHCRWEKPLGTNLRYRLCRPVFLDRATTARGQDFYYNVTGQGMTYAPPVELEFARHQPILKQKLEETVRSSPELQEAMYRHQQLKEELDARKSMSAEKD